VTVCGEVGDQQRCLSSQGGYYGQLLWLKCCYAVQLKYPANPNCELAGLNLGAAWLLVADVLVLCTFDSQQLNKHQLTTVFSKLVASHLMPVAAMLILTRPCSTPSHVHVWQQCIVREWGYSMSHAKSRKFSRREI